MIAGPARAAAQKVEAGLLGELRALKHAGFAGASARVRRMAHAMPDALTAACAAALFASSLSACSRPADTEVAAAIRDALRAYDGTRGCTGEVAAAYGEHPETAAPRMRWALQLVQDAFPRCSDRRRKPPRPAAVGMTAPGASAPSSAGNRPRRPDSMPLEAPPPQGKISDRAASGWDDNNEQSPRYRVDNRTRGAA